MLDEVAFDLLLPNLVHLFLVLGHQGSGDGLCDSINLGQMTSTLHTGRDGRAVRLLTAFADLQDRWGWGGLAHFGQATSLGAAPYSGSCLFQRAPPLGQQERRPGCQLLAVRPRH